tara:strand:- start:3531 stop:4391 length:861 start_codon:yes stop_codon:yes gene_type:complete
MRALLATTIFILFPFAIQAQSPPKIKIQFDCYEIPTATYEALGKHLDQGGKAASDAFAKLSQLPGVEPLATVENTSQSGERRKLEDKSFSVEIDPFLGSDGLISLNYVATLSLRDTYQFTGSVKIPLNEPYLINSWEDTNGENAITVFVTGTVPNQSPTSEHDLKQARSSLRVLRFKSSTDAEFPTTEEAEREGRLVYQQTMISLSGQRNKGEVGDERATDHSIEWDPVISADRSQMDLSITYREGDDVFQGKETVPLGQIAYIALKQDGKPSRYGILINSVYQRP